LGELDEDHQSTQDNSVANQVFSERALEHDVILCKQINECDDRTMLWLWQSTGA
jgi:hypothetical protein